MGEVKEQWPGSVIGLGFFCTKEIEERDRLEFSDAQLDFCGLPPDRITALAKSLGASWMTGRLRLQSDCDQRGPGG